MIERTVTLGETRTFTGPIIGNGVSRHLYLTDDETQDDCNTGDIQVGLQGQVFERLGNPTRLRVTLEVIE